MAVLSSILSWTQHEFLSRFFPHRCRPGTCLYAYHCCRDLPIRQVHVVGPGPGHLWRGHRYVRVSTSDPLVGLAVWLAWGPALGGWHQYAPHSLMCPIPTHAALTRHRPRQTATNRWIPGSAQHPYFQEHVLHPVAHPDCSGQFWSVRGVCTSGCLRWDSGLQWWLQCHAVLHHGDQQLPGPLGIWCRKPAAMGEPTLSLHPGLRTVWDVDSSLPALHKLHRHASVRSLIWLLYSMFWYHTTSGHHPYRGRWPHYERLWLCATVYGHRYTRWRTYSRYALRTDGMGLLPDM